VSKEPYWRLITEGAHLGYVRGGRVGKWVARYRKPGSGSGYVKNTLAEADDIRDADGVDILSFAQADQAARAWFEAQVSGRAVPTEPFSVSDALDEYIEAYRGKALADMRSRTNRIKPTLGHYQVMDLTAKILSEWHLQRSRCQPHIRAKNLTRKPVLAKAMDPESVRRRRSTANRELTVLKAALNRAALYREWLPLSAWSRVKAFAKVDVAKRRYLSDEEARLIVNACEEEFRPMVKAALLTGARYGELCHARVRDFDPQSRTLWIAETKSGNPRAAYLDPEGVSLMERSTLGRGPNEYLFIRADGESWKPSQQLRRMAEAYSAAKIAKTGFHDLRRTFGARMALRGVPMAVIAEALGHADERITRKHYAHLAPSYVADTVRAAIAGMGIVEPSNVERIRSAVPSAAAESQAA
jgi:integrase